MKIKLESKYLKAGVNIKDGDIITLLDEGKYEMKTGQYGTKKVLSFNVLLADGSEKIYSANTTTQKNLIKAWGDDTSDWVNKRIRAWIVKQVIAGEMKDILVFTPEGANSAQEEVKEEEIPIIESEE